MSTIVHFEIPAEDVERAVKFYSKLFGWEIKKVPELDYWMISTDGEEGGAGGEGGKAVGGGMLKRQDPSQRAINYIGVSSVDEYIKKVEELGGGISVPRMAVPGWGYFAVCLDMEGNAFGLWEDDKDAK
jgi:predicted enzyme related to lactoylglutathione lyase